MASARPKELQEKLLSKKAIAANEISTGKFFLIL